jgi:hypothetical protein
MFQSLAIDVVCYIHPLPCNWEVLRLPQICGTSTLEMSYPTELTVSWVSVSAVELFTFQPTFIAKLSGLPRYFRISDMPTSIFATSPIAVLARSTVRLVAFIQHPPVGGFDGIQIPTPRYLDVEIMTSDEPQCLAPCRPRYAASRTLTCDL